MKELMNEMQEKYLRHSASSKIDLKFELNFF